MATTEFTIAPASMGEKFRQLSAALFVTLLDVVRAVRNRRSVNKLLEWDEHMLRDIGLTRGDVRSALSAPIADDPSYRLGAMSVERRAAFRAQARERLFREHRLETMSDMWRKPTKL